MSTFHLLSEKKLRQSSGLPLKQLLIEVHQVTDTNSSNALWAEDRRIAVGFVRNSKHPQEKHGRKMNNV
jgi:hypothetical protein